MCVAVTCPKCERPDWRGCGRHVEQVLGHVPKAKRCQCPKEASPSLLQTLKNVFTGGR